MGWPDPLGAVKSFGAAMDRLYTDPGVTEAEASALGHAMHSLLGAPEQSGPPYVHTFVSPRPCPTHCDDDCELNDGGCHERHAEPMRRDHNPDECEALQRPGPLGGITLTEGE